MTRTPADLHRYQHAHALPSYRGSSCLASGATPVKSAAAEQTASEWRIRATRENTNMNGRTRMMIYSPRSSLSLTVQDASYFIRITRGLRRDYARAIDPSLTLSLGTVIFCASKKKPLLISILDFIYLCERVRRR